MLTGVYSLRVSANFCVTFNTAKSNSHIFNAAKLSQCMETSKPVLLKITNFRMLFLREIFRINWQNKWVVIEGISSRKELHGAKLKLVKIPVSASGTPKPWQGLIQSLKCSIASAESHSSSRLDRALLGTAFQAQLCPVSCLLTVLSKLALITPGNLS